METNTKANTEKESSMERESTHGRTHLPLKVTSLKA